MKKQNYYLLTVIIALALCCAMLAGCGRIMTRSGESAGSVISVATGSESMKNGVLLLKVNPEIAVSYDEAGLVTDIAGRNPEGIAIVESYGNYAGKDCRTVVSELVTAIANRGYFVDSVDSGRRTITIELEIGSGMPSESFLENIVTEVQTKVAENNWNGTVEVNSTAVSIDATTSATPNSGAAATDIGADEAKSIALKHAGVAASDVTFARTEKDYDNGRWVYEVEFYSQSMEYDYDIDASNGTILSYDHDAEYYTRPTSTPNSGASATDIGADEAKSIALKHAGVSASDVTFARTEKDYDNGKWVYEVEFYSQSMEYDYDIDASNGTILSYDHDAEYYTRPTSSGSSTGYIGIENAKKIALNHAGLSASEVSFSKAKFEDDDGRQEYEVEFYYKGAEYEYVIDASGGNIVEYSIDHND